MSDISEDDTFLIPMIEEALPDFIQAYRYIDHVDAASLIERGNRIVHDTYTGDLDRLNLSGIDDPKRYVEDSALASAVAIQVLHAVAMHLIEEESR